MTASQHTIAGRVLTMPVQIRKATQHMAMFSVDADAAQHLIDYSRLRVCRYLPGRAIVVLMLMHYIDGDLGQYHEFGTSVMVNPPGSNASGPRALQSAGAFIHHLPVDQPFTLEAGTKIWGYPKVMADFTVREGRRFGFECSVDAATSSAAHVLTPRRDHARNGLRTHAGRRAQPNRRSPGPARRSPLCERTCVAGPSEARDAVQLR
jgi:Acetoacetate decarboxylase (ADC)